MSSCFNRNSRCGCNNNTNSCGCTGNNNFCGCNNSCSGVGGTTTGTTCGCSNNWWNGCSGVAGTGTNGWRPPHFPFPPIGSVCGTCPPGTRPCHQCNPWWNGCGCNNNCGCGNNDDSRGTYAFFNSTGSTLTTGSIIPLRFVIGSGDLGRGTTGGTVSLDEGIYSVEYSVNATADLEGSTITITPEYLGALHPEYSRSFTTSAANQTFDIAGSFVVKLPSDTTLSLNVTITPSGTDAATLTDVNASMLIRRISGCGCN